MATGHTCGVGGWGGPAPGDPSNNSTLSATSALGGIEVSWTYPTTNPQAVAYTKVYRSLSTDFTSAILVADAGGDRYFDRLDSATRYYYWIRIVSVNGTVGELIGPATAIARSTIAAVIEGLTGVIDSGFLATSLKNELDRIQVLDLALAGEVVSRENGETTLSAAMADVDAGIAETLTFLANEQTSRADGDSALAESINLVAVTAADNLAAATTVLRAEIDAATGSVTAEMLDTVVAETASNLAAAQTTLSASITTERDRITSLASHVDAVESAADSALASAATSLSTSITTVDGKATAIGALYTAKVSVTDGTTKLIGGFGVYNDGSSVEAGFDVDKFWIGRTAANKRKPFIVVDGVVYIDSAVINTLDANKINAGSLRGRNMQAGSLIMKGSFSIAAVVAGASSITVDNITDFPAVPPPLGGGEGGDPGQFAVIIDKATADRDWFFYTGISGNTLTGIGPTGANTSISSAHPAGVTVVPYGENLILDTNTNEMRFFGDRGDGVIDELASIGIQTVGSDTVIGRFGSGSGAGDASGSGSNRIAVFGTSYSNVGVQGSSRTSYGVLGSSYSSYGVWGVSNTGAGVNGFSSSGFGGMFSGNATRGNIGMPALSGRPSTRSVDSIAMILTTGGTVDNRTATPKLMYTDGTNWRLVSTDAIWTG